MFRGESEFERNVLKTLSDLADLDRVVVALLRQLVVNTSKPKVLRYEIIQIGDNLANSITGIVQGAVGTFQGLAVPAGSVVTGVPAWTSDNPLAVITVDPKDSTGLSISVAVDKTASGSFNLSIKSTNPDGSVATGTANIPVLPAPPPPPVAVVSFDINQTS